MISLPSNHPQRFVLSNEVHARPPEPLEAPVRVSCIALKSDHAYEDSDRANVIELAEQYGATPPAPGTKHYAVDLRDFRFIWERHTEFIRYTFIVPSDGPAFSRTAIEAAPQAWLAALPGEIIAGAHVELVSSAVPDATKLSKTHFSGHALIGSRIGDTGTLAVTDFRSHQDGFTRFLVFDAGMTRWQAGQLVQRLLEVETYRIMALLGLPVAQSIVPDLGVWERELSGITAEMTEPENVDEVHLLDRLTKLQAAIEKSYTTSQFRFSASAAYHALVLRRIEELRESRVDEFQGFREFTERRLAPAMATCRSVDTRLAAVSERVDRAAQLLSTRVNLSLEHQNAKVLDSMNRRVELQLRLQQTVEGLSVAAITYYGTGLVSHVVKGLNAAGLSLNEPLLVAIALPILAGAALFGVWHTRRLIRERDKQDKDD